VRSVDLGLHAPAETATGARAKHDNAMARSGIILRHKKATEKELLKRRRDMFSFASSPAHKRSQRRKMGNCNLHPEAWLNSFQCSVGKLSIRNTKNSQAATPIYSLVIALPVTKPVKKLGRTL